MLETLSIILQNLSLFIALILWSLFWKAWALWTAARNKEKIWFIVLLLVNTAGILEIIYLFMRKEIQKVCCPTKKRKR